MGSTEGTGEERTVRNSVRVSIIDNPANGRFGRVYIDGGYVGTVGRGDVGVRELVLDGLGVEQGRPVEGPDFGPQGPDATLISPKVAASIRLFLDDNPDNERLARLIRGADVNALRRAAGLADGDPIFDDRLPADGGEPGGRVGGHEAHPSGPEAVRQAQTSWPGGASRRGLNAAADSGFERFAGLYADAQRRGDAVTTLLMADVFVWGVGAVANTPKGLVNVSPTEIFIGPLGSVAAAARERVEDLLRSLSDQIHPEADTREGYLARRRLVTMLIDAFRGMGD